MIWLDYPTQYAQIFCWPCLHRRADPPTGTGAGANNNGKDIILKFKIAKIVHTAMNNVIDQFKHGHSNRNN